MVERGRAGTGPGRGPGPGKPPGNAGSFSPLANAATLAPLMTSLLGRSTDRPPAGDAPGAIFSWNKDRGGRRGRVTKMGKVGKKGKLASQMRGKRNRGGQGSARLL